MHPLEREIWRGKLKKLPNEKCPLQDLDMERKLKIMQNEKHPLDDLKNDEITEKLEKREMTTVGPGIWREN